LGLWFAVFPNVEGLLAQLLAAIFVLGSYFLAEYLKVRRPMKLGQTPVQRPDSPPLAESEEAGLVGLPLSEGQERFYC
jgi:high-affinity iron transporter